MNFWKRRGDEAATAQTMQLRDRERHPYAGLRSFTPQRGGELRLYQAVREAVPVVDAAVCKLIRLSGGALVFCEDPETEKRLRDFLERVPAGRGQYGINAFLEQYLESLLICGGAVGEMVPAAGNRNLAALLCGRMDRIELREGESPLDFQIFGPDERGRMAALPYQELLLFTPLHPEAEHPYGVSLLRGLPFMADILMKIYNTVGVNWERCGNMRFAVTCRDGDGNAAERGQLLASEWSRAMQDTRSGSVRDFVGGGRCGYQGHRRRRAHSGQPGAGAAGVGADRGEDLHPALYAGAELELHGADERPAGGYAHHRDHCYSTDADTGGGADLPDVAADAGRDGRVPGGLGGYQLAG